VLASVHEHTEFVVDSLRNVQPMKLVCIIRVRPRSNFRVSLTTLVDRDHSDGLTERVVQLRAVRSWSLRLSALMDSDLAWVNGKSAR